MSQNKPLNRAQVKLLPIRQSQLVPDGRGGLKEQVDFDGFTPTSNGANGKDRRSIKQSGPHHNAKATPGRIQQHVIVQVKRKTKFGEVLHPTNRTKKIQTAPQPTLGVESVSSKRVKALIAKVKDNDKSDLKKAS